MLPILARGLITHLYLLQLWILLIDCFLFSSTSYLYLLPNSYFGVLDYLSF